MNISSSFNYIKDINYFLGAFNAADWKSQQISPNDVQQFIINNIKILANHHDKKLLYLDFFNSQANSQDKELHDHLMTLSDRITNEWNNPEANILAFEIMCIAKGIFNEGSDHAPELLDEIWQQILSKIPPRTPATPDIHEKTGGIASGLEDVYPSKRVSEIARSVEGAWASKELVSLKKYGPQTAQEAVQYAIDHQLTGANLFEFDDLNENDLKILFENCPNLIRLSICSPHITSLPIEAKAITELICAGCVNLQSLPEQLQLQNLDCTGCTNLQSLPKLPQLQKLNCSGCTSLINLPELPLLIELNCQWCSKLQSLRSLPQVNVLDCSVCDNLHSLPELPQVKVLDCSVCKNLKSLPELPQVEVLDCSVCKKLQYLPALPHVQHLDCRKCVNLLSLPDLPEGVKVER